MSKKYREASHEECLLHVCFASTSQMFVIAEYKCITIMYHEIEKESPHYEPVSQT